MGETIIKIIVTLALAAVIIALLPNSPVTSYIAQLGEIPYIHEINWFIPFGKMMDLTAIWFALITTYYTVRWIGRQLDIIAD